MNNEEIKETLNDLLELSEATVFVTDDESEFTVADFQGLIYEKIIDLCYLLGLDELYSEGKK